MSVPVTPDAWQRLGHRIRAERERRGMSRRALAELAGISSGSVQSAEKGFVPRGRWPQTLSAIERALGWSPGSMRSVLDGGDVEYQPTLFDEMAAAGDAGADAVLATAGGAQQIFQAKYDSGTSGESGPTIEWWFRQLDGMDLPEEIRKVLPQVSFFATTSVIHGTPDWLANAFANTVYMMLDPIHQHRVQERLERPVTTVEESDQRLEDLEEELARVRKSKEAMEALLLQVAGSQAAAQDPQFRADIEKLRSDMEADE